MDAGDARAVVIILAAGKSVRMGTLKQLLNVCGKKMVERVVNVANEAKVGDVVLVLGHAAERIMKEAKLVGAKVVINKGYEEGIASSIRAGMRFVKNLPFVIMLADQPLVKPETIKKLVDTYYKGKAKAVVPRYKGFNANPVLFSPDLKDEMLQLKGDKGAKSILLKHEDKVDYVEVDDEGVAIDIDTEEDYFRVRSALNCPDLY